MNDMSNPAVWAQVAPAFVQGLVLSLGLIVAIGAQNAFVLRQGLRREHVGSVVAFCAVADALLVCAGVLGMAQALGDRPLVFVDAGDHPLALQQNTGITHDQARQLAERCLHP